MTLNEMKERINNMCAREHCEKIIESYSSVSDSIASLMAVIAERDKHYKETGVYDLPTITPKAEKKPEKKAKSKKK